MTRKQHRLYVSAHCNWTSKIPGAFTIGLAAINWLNANAGVLHCSIYRIQHIHFSYRAHIAWTMTLMIIVVRSSVT